MNRTDLRLLFLKCNLFSALTIINKIIQGIKFGLRNLNKYVHGVNFKSWKVSNAVGSAF